MKATKITLIVFFEFNIFIIGVGILKSKELLNTKYLWQGKGALNISRLMFDSHVFLSFPFIFLISTHTCQAFILSSFFTLLMIVFTSKNYIQKCPPFNITFHQIKSKVHSIWNPTEPWIHGMCMKQKNSLRTLQTIVENSKNAYHNQKNEFTMILPPGMSRMTWHEFVDITSTKEVMIKTCPFKISCWFILV